MKTTKSTVRYLKTHYSQTALLQMLKIAKSVRDQLKPCKSEQDILSNTKLKTYSGLCYMLDKLGNKNNLCFYTLVEDCSKSWKFATGIPTHPIKESIKDGRWEGKNLKSRKRLLKHIIKCLEMSTGTYKND